MPAVENIRLYPIKGLDGIEVETATFVEGGTLGADREFALFDANDDVINGKRTPKVHDLRTDFDPETKTVELTTPEGTARRFNLDDEGGRDSLEAFCSDFFEVDLALRRDRSLGYVDRREMGPSVISTGTVEEIASWFDEMTIEGARRRLRANIEVSGVEPFWEDRFVGSDAPAFTVGDVRFEGVTPCGRCVVPERDPDTGEAIADFRERFSRKRQETFPSFADPDAFDHYYTAMLIARVPKAHRGETITVGDLVSAIQD